MGDVLLGFCHTGFVYTPFMMSVIAIREYELSQPPSRLGSYWAQQGCIIADSRNDVVRKFLETEYEWLWMLDPDVQFPPDTLRKMLAAADPKDAPIIASPYWNQYEDGQRYVVWIVRTEKGMQPVARLPEGEVLVQVDGCGMGCTLIHRGVLEALQEAHRDDPWTWFGHDIVYHGDVPHRAGEDVTFCLRAKELGFTTYGYTGAPVEHFKPHFMEHGGTTRELVAA